MAGRRRKVDHLAPSSSRRTARPRKRQDITTVPESEQSRLKALAESISNLLSHRNDDGSLPENLIELTAFEQEIAPYQLLKLVRQFETYHEHYPNQPSANALTPPIRGRSVRDPYCTLQSKEDSNHNPPRKRPHIMTVKNDDTQKQIIEYAAQIAELVQLQDANGGRLPDGELHRVAKECERSPDWIEKQMKHLRAYRIAYSDNHDYNDANAFVPLSTGRPKGRKVKDDIKQVIENAALNKEWPSLDGQGTVSTIKNQPIGPRLIHSLVTQAFPNEALSESTIWRIYNDYRNKHPTQFRVTRNGTSELQKVLPWIDNKTSGVLERMQLDVRPLPIVITYKGVTCTLRAIMVVDDYSDYKPVWHILPAKRIDNDQEVLGQDYTCQKIRELIAITFLRLRKRCRIIYPDNGSIFARLALGPYMYLLVFPGEDPTLLINRGRKKPRGGGNIENELGLLDSFLQFRPRYIREDDYRTSLNQGKKEELKTYEDIKIDFDAFMHHNNHDSINGRPSCFQRFNEGPDRSLSLPSMENLAVFAMSQKSQHRSPNPGGFWLDKKQYVPGRRDPNIYEALADAAARHQKITINKYILGEYHLVFFSLDEETWEWAIPKDEANVIWQQHVKLMGEVEQSIRQSGGEATQFIKTLLEVREKPLILNGLRKQPQFETLEDAQKDIAEIAASPHRQVMPRLTEELFGMISDSAIQESVEHDDISSKERGTGNQSSTKHKKQRIKHRRTPPKDQSKISEVINTDQSCDETSETSIDDTDDLLRQLNEHLGCRNSDEV